MHFTVHWKHCWHSIRNFIYLFTTLHNLKSHLFEMSRLDRGEGWGEPLMAPARAEVSRSCVMAPLLFCLCVLGCDIEGWLPWAEVVTCAWRWWAWIAWECSNICTVNIDVCRVVCVHTISKYSKDPSMTTDEEKPTKHNYKGVLK